MSARMSIEDGQGARDVYERFVSQQGSRLQFTVLKYRSYI